MKPWIKRSLFGLFGGALVAGSMAGCAAHRWHDMSADDMRAKIVERVSSKLELDATQKQKLEVLGQKLQAQRQNVRGAGGAGEPRSQFRSLFAGDKFDQAGAAKLVQEKTAAVQAGSPEVIAATADFFNSLNPAQQQKVRAFMDQGGRRWGRHG